MSHIIARPKKVKGWRLEMAAERWNGEEGSRQSDAWAALTRPEWLSFGGGDECLGFFVYIRKDKTTHDAIGRGGRGHHAPARLGKVRLRVNNDAEGGRVTKGPFRSFVYRLEHKGRTVLRFALRPATIVIFQICLVILNNFRSVFRLKTTRRQTDGIECTVRLI
ncbi:unnamed protein product [Amoebophrya sp. A25]|nr:unnamed protein product [Amoebophrya sp. A25]|eukprot:GSA25T00007446001.1